MGKVAIVIAAIIVFGLLIDRALAALGVAAFNLPGATVDLGALVALAGVALEMWSTRTLWLAGGTPNPSWPPPTLVTNGPYRWVRHPLYVARVLIVLGAALALRSGGVLAMALALAAVVAGILVPREERRLAAKFPTGFSAFADATPRFAPRRGSR
ncbi:MAG: methyltransferase family protein [Thermoplasmatota archaeon]